MQQKERRQPKKRWNRKKKNYQMPKKNLNNQIIMSELQHTVTYGAQERITTKLTMLVISLVAETWMGMMW